MKCIIYKSIPAKELKNRVLNSMLNYARNFNRANNITGCIFINHEKIVQIIEGDDDTLDSLYNRILKDNRHLKIETLIDKPINSRVMQDWAMAVYNVDGNEEDEPHFNKLSLIEQLYKSPDVDIIETINKEVLA